MVNATLIMNRNVIVNNPIFGKSGFSDTKYALYMRDSLLQFRFSPAIDTIKYCLGHLHSRIEDIIITIITKSNNAHPGKHPSLVAT